jgi:outer membrane protein TolC
MFESGRFSSRFRWCCLLGLFSLNGVGVAAPSLPVPGQPAPTYTLNDCLQLALERNPGILKAQKDIERTQGLIITAKSTLYPQVSLNGRIEERDDDLFRQGQDPTIYGFRDFWTIQLAVSQSLYSGGANRQQIAIAKLQHASSLLQFQATIDQVLRDVKYAAYTIVVNQAQIDAEKQTVALLTKEEARQKELFDAGRTTRFNILRTEVNLGNQSATLHQTENDLVSSELALSHLLNIEWPRQQSPFNPPFLIHVDLDCPPIGRIQVGDFIALALDRRPELQVADRQIDIAERQIKFDQAALLPHIYAYAADEDARDQTEVSFNSNINDYAFGLLGTWNIFDGFSTKGQVITDQAALGSTYISRDELHLQVQNEVREAYARLLNAQANIQSQTANVKTAEESVGLAQLSADTGYATLLDVLQATIDLTSARTEEIRTKQLYMDAMADLEHAVSLKFVDWPENKAIPAAAPATTAQPDTTSAPVPDLQTTPPPTPATNAPSAAPPVPPQ